MLLTWMKVKMYTYVSLNILYTAFFQMFCLSFIKVICLSYKILDEGDDSLFDILINWLYVSVTFKIFSPKLFVFDPWYEDHHFQILLKYFLLLTVRKHLRWCRPWKRPIISMSLMFFLTYYDESWHDFDRRSWI